MGTVLYKISVKVRLSATDTDTALKLAEELSNLGFKLVYMVKGLINTTTWGIIVRFEKLFSGTTRELLEQVKNVINHVRHYDFEVDVSEVKVNGK